MLHSLATTLTIQSVRPALTFAVAQGLDVGQDVDCLFNLATPVRVGQAVTLAELNVRELPAANAAVRGLLDSGAKCELWGRSGVGRLVRAGDLHGWSLGEWLAGA